MSKNLKHTIYSSSDCLSEKMLFDYIDNKLSQKERHIVEKHILACEMCSDALEGLELVKDRNRITFIKEAINKRVLENIHKEGIVVSFNYKMAFSVAATIALLVVGVFFFNKTALKESHKSGMAELKTDESPQATPPPPPLIDEKETTVNRTNVGKGKTATETKGEEFKLSPQKIADQEIALAEEQKAPEGGYYKNSADDGENRNQQAPDETIVNGVVVVMDAVTTADDRQNNNLETVSIPRTSVNEREKDAKLEDGKKAEEKVAAASGGTYAWSTPTPEQNKNQKTKTKAAEDASGDQAELAKKSDKGGKYPTESTGKGKDKIATKENRADEDLSKTESVAYEPKSVQQDNDELKSETKNTTANNTSSTNNNSVFETTIAADSTEPVFTIVEVMPEYPGGNVALANTINKELTYPVKDDSNEIYNTIIIEFVVNSSGKAINAKLVKPQSKELEKQLKEFINKMPLWKAGKQNNKNVAVKLVLPVKINIK